jgi:DNA-binding phage protein
MQSAGASTVAKKRAKAPEPGPRSDVHRKLRKLVEDRKGDRSFADVARAAGMTPQSFSRLLNGGIPDPRWSTVVDVLKAIGMTLCDFERS